MVCLYLPFALAAANHQKKVLINELDSDYSLPSKDNCECSDHDAQMNSNRVKKFQLKRFAMTAAKMREMMEQLVIL
jgi:hypothetical protein